MIDNSKQNSGVYYRREDYAGLLKRSIAWTVDLIMLAIFLGILWCSLYYIISNELLVFKISFWSFVFSTYLYLSVLKPSRFRTLGYIVAGLKIVDLYGNKPTWNTMLTRFLLLGFSPFALIVDLLWLTGEKSKQTLRDKYVGTYVVENGSSPIGRRPLRKVVLNFLGWNLYYKEVELENTK